MRFTNCYFINGTAYAGKSTLVHQLAMKYGGIECPENYHDSLLNELDSLDYPYVTYTRDLKDWHEFIRRSPEEYEKWFDGATKECERLELQILSSLSVDSRKIFVDTNITTDTLKLIAEPEHVLIMLAEPEVSVRQFFERPDLEKQFLYRLIMEEPDPVSALDYYRRGLERINSRERYDRFLSSGFNVLLRDENRTVSQTVDLAERLLGLKE